jgi:hypothetical protein
MASGMPNVNRQVGGGHRGSDPGNAGGHRQSFVSGMHLAFVIAAGVLVLALGAAWVIVRTLIPLAQAAPG